MGHDKNARAKRPFTQVNVFSADPLGGNPLAVVHRAEGLSEADMVAFARWTNLSETTFLLSPTDAGADYYLRIFTPAASYPSLATRHSAHATPGSRRAENHASRMSSCSNAAWASSACAATVRGSSSPRHLCAVPARSNPIC